MSNKPKDPTGNPPKEAPRPATERRAYRRKHSAVAVEYQFAGRRCQGYMVDISLGGLCLETREEHKVGERLAVAFRLLPQREWPVEARGRVVSATRRPNGYWRLGLQFEGPLGQHDVAFFLMS
jgi:hypothetical protein